MEEDYKPVNSEDGTIVDRPYSGSTVTVACKMPNGMILQLCVKRSHTEPVLGGGHRDFEQFHPVGAKIKVNGPRHPFGVMPKYRIVGGYALTEGVPEQFFNDWLDQHRDDESVRNNLIFAFTREANVIAKAKDFRAQKSGLESLVLDSKGQLTDERIFKPKGMEISSAEEMTGRTPGSNVVTAIA